MIQGDAIGMNSLGRFHEYGITVPESKEEAFAWYEKAANKELGDGLVSVIRCSDFGVNCV